MKLVWKSGGASGSDREKVPVTDNNIIIEDGQ
jgi:hypothetical protein